eukprot:GHVN01077193.1.p2 GENE.GHVN01077193.1~~GHVN01077193.1.p2  ORF type:complete len:316 (-),score=60.69 GHVN01077193.1:1411-2358(-)
MAVKAACERKCRIELKAAKSLLHHERQRRVLAEAETQRLVAGGLDKLPLLTAVRHPSSAKGSIHGGGTEDNENSEEDTLLSLPCGHIEKPQSDVGGTLISGRSSCEETIKLRGSPSTSFAFPTQPSPSPFFVTSSDAAAANAMRAAPVHTPTGAAANDVPRLLETIKKLKEMSAALKDDVSDKQAIIVHLLKKHSLSQEDALRAPPVKYTNSAFASLGGLFTSSSGSSLSEQQMQTVMQEYMLENVRLKIDLQTLSEQYRTLFTQKPQLSSRSPVSPVNNESDIEAHPKHGPQRTSSRESEDVTLFHRETDRQVA